MTKSEKIIIDTDIGDDIDDALAIALAIRSPELTLLGITTVYKNTRLRARIAQNLLKAADAETIPVVPGLGNPLCGTADCEEMPCQLDDAMEEFTPATPADAVEFIRETVTASPGEVTLIAIGPLTNLAAAIQRFPEIKDSVKRIVLMGGAYFSHRDEYNIVCDPEAAKIVFESGIPIVAVGLDVTIPCRLSREETARLQSGTSRLTQLLGRLISLHQKASGGWPIYLHDPLAVSVTFDETLVTLEEKRIGVELRGELTRGMTFNLSDAAWQEQDHSPVRVCRTVDRDRVVELFLSRLCE